MTSHTGVFSDPDTASPDARASVSAAVSARMAFSVFAGSVLISIALRALYLMQPWRIDWATFPMFLGDEGTHGLMALHILRGARPVFYYGGYYHGALDAYVSAASFWLFGDSLAALRLTPTLFALASIPVAYGIGRHMYGRREGFLAAALVALPSHLVFEWGSKSLCAYCGYVFLILAMLYLVLLLLEQVTVARLLVFGLVVGVSAWNNQLALGYIAVSALVLFLWVPLRRQDVVCLVIAGLIGVSPLIYGNIVYPLSTVRQLGRKALFAWTLTKEHAKAEEEDQNEEEHEYRSLPLLEVTGAQPRRDGSWSTVGIIGTLFLALGLLGALQRGYRSRTRDPADFRRHAFLLACVLVGIGAGIGGFSGQPVGRYQLPLYPLLSVLAVGSITRLAPRVSVWVVAVLALAQGISLAVQTPPEQGTPRKEIVDALKAKDLRYGYAAGQMYDLIFAAREQIVFVPLDHSRYAPYEREVGAADNIFYLYRTDQEDKDAHRAFMRFLQKAGVTYQHMAVGDYRVLYAFEPRAAISRKSIAKMQREFRKEKFGR